MEPDSAQNYNIIIWTVFSVGVVSSLLILYEVWDNKHDMGSMHLAMAVLGMFILFYCTLTIESFGQKKSLIYEKDNNLHKKIKDLPFYRVDWLAEIVLFGSFLSYIILFGYIIFLGKLTIHRMSGTFVAETLFVLSITLMIIILLNWIRRPPNKNGNFLERIRLYVIRK